MTEENDDIEDQDDDTEEDAAPGPDEDPVSVDPTRASSETASVASHPANVTLGEAPAEVMAQVLPLDLPSDTREIEALKAAGRFPGLTEQALDALEELEKSHDQIIGWLEHAQAQIKKVRRL